MMQALPALRQPLGASVWRACCSLQHLCRGATRRQSLKVAGLNILHRGLLDASMSAGMSRLQLYLPAYRVPM